MRTIVDYGNVRRRGGGKTWSAKEIGNQRNNNRLKKRDTEKLAFVQKAYSQ